MLPFYPKPEREKKPARQMIRYAMELGAKVIIYTIILRGSAQTSYVGTVLALTATGITVDSVTGKLFFPWSAIERVTW